MMVNMVFSQEDQYEAPMVILLSQSMSHILTTYYLEF